jgi:pimeloyl-ACP methyl ester carboxylesterase
VQLSYFGAAEKQLVGLYSPPTGPVDRDAAVLICHSAPQEYMRSYWALRQLATRLAAAGFHAFRFDYYGTGDSAGASDEGDLDQWRRDIASALDELRDVSGVRRPSLVGFRLGATLAAMTDLRVKDLVLWEPVVSGTEYLQELREAHRSFFAHLLYPPTVTDHGPLLEVLGHPLSSQVQNRLEALVLAPPLSCSADRVSIVASEGRASHQALVENITARGIAAHLEAVAEAFTPGSPFLLATKPQERIVNLLTRRSQ